MNCGASIVTQRFARAYEGGLNSARLDVLDGSRFCFHNIIWV